MINTNVFFDLTFRDAMASGGQTKRISGLGRPKEKKPLDTFAQPSDTHVFQTATGSAPQQWFVGGVVHGRGPVGEGKNLCCFCTFFKCQ